MNSEQKTNNARFICFHMGSVCECSDYYLVRFHKSIEKTETEIENERGYCKCHQCDGVIFISTERMMLKQMVNKNTEPSMTEGRKKKHQQ